MQTTAKRPRSRTRMRRSARWRRNSQTGRGDRGNSRTIRSSSKGRRRPAAETIAAAPGRPASKRKPGRPRAVVRPARRATALTGRPTASASGIRSAAGRRARPAWLSSSHLTAVFSNCRSIWLPRSTAESRACLADFLPANAPSISSARGRAAGPCCRTADRGNSRSVPCW